jgi:hypothetical protein
MILNRILVRNFGFLCSSGKVHSMVGIGLICIIFMVQLAYYFEIRSDPNPLATTNFLGKEGQVHSWFTLVILLVGLLLSISGFRSILQTCLDGQQPNRNFSYRSCNMTRVPFGNIFYLSCISYLIVFLFTSNTVIYKGLSFSQSYGVGVPSLHLIPCCGIPGSYPVLTIYLTHHIGLMLTPTGLILCAFLPLLVGLNTELIFSRLKMKHQKSSREKKCNEMLTLIGSSSGLLSACPSCAGTIIISLLGIGTGTTGIFAFMNDYAIQALLILISGLSFLYSTTTLVKKDLQVKKISC